MENKELQEYVDKIIDASDKRIHDMFRKICEVTSSGELAGLISPVDEFDSHTSHQAPIV